MNVNQVRDVCASYPGVQSDRLIAPANILVYSVAGKKFAYFKTSEPERWRFSLRVSPERFLELTDQPGVKPARYMQRFHWVTIVNVSGFDEQYLTNLINWSYNKALGGLSKKKRLEINAGSLS